MSGNTTKGVGLMGLGVGLLAIGASGGLAAIPALAGMVMVGIGHRAAQDDARWGRMVDKANKSKG